MDGKYNHVIEGLSEIKEEATSKMKNTLKQTVSLSLEEIKDKFGLKSLSFEKDNSVSVHDAKAEFLVSIDGEEIETIIMIQNDNGEPCFGYRKSEKYLDPELSQELALLMSFVSDACYKFELDL